MSIWRANNGAIKTEFSDPESFRLCTEGLAALERYHRSPSKDDLDLAEERFRLCVNRYPNDVLPKFYLGSVETLTGLRQLDSAVQHLQEVIQAKKNPDLTFAAKYNLAVAYIEWYDDAAFVKADAILKDLERDPSTDKSRQRTIWMAHAIRLYLQGHRLWKDREHLSEDDMNRVRSMHGVFDDFKAALDKSDFREDSLIQAEYWNALAALFETEAHVDKNKGKIAEEYYAKALSYRPGYIGYRENVARLYQEVFRERDKALAMWNELLELWPDGDYIHLNLGRLFRSDAETAKSSADRTGAVRKAADHYAKSKLPEAQEELDQLKQKYSSLFA